MKIWSNTWRWVKNHIEAINFGVVLLVVAWVAWFSVHTLSVETELRIEKEFLSGELTKTQHILESAVNHINDQHSVISNQKQLIESQSAVMKKLMERIDYLTALLNGDIT